MFSKRVTRWAWCAFLAAGLVLFGCSDSSNGGGDGGQDGCVGGGKVLSIVGSPNRTIFAGEEETLQVVFLEQCVGAVSGEVINFQIIGDAAGSTLDSNAVTTGANGLATVTLKGGNPNPLAPPPQFQVWANHPDDPDGRYFSITLKPVFRELSGGVNLECWVDETLDLNAKVTDTNSNTPVRGVSVKFRIDNPPAGGDASIPSDVAVTNLSGVATVTFHSGSMATHYQVVAEGLDEELGNTTYNITVKSRQTCVTDEDCPDGYVCVNGSCRETGGTECETDDECPEGYECKNGFCRPAGSLPGSCETSQDCPPGYFCENHQCYPCEDTTPDPNCEGGSGCIADEDCPPGFVCRDGICYPATPPDGPIPELAGTWYTQHYFDLSDAIGGDIALDIVNTLNELFNYCELTGIGFVDDLLCDLIHEYIPEWVLTLIDIFANLANILSELRVEGEMELTHLTPRELISGTETWDIILIRYLNACCEGQPQGCNPYNQPDFPDCATIDMAREDIEYGEAVFRVEAFTGKVSVDDSGAITKYTLGIDERKIQIEFSKFVAFIIDLLIQIFTGYDSLDEALMDVIDCEAINDLVEDISGGWAPDITQACENFKPTASSLLRNLLNQIGVGWKILKFKGWATVTVEGDPPYGIELGFTNHETSGDGHWDGDITIILSGGVDGSWYAER
jgi:hypothetical protein